MAFLDEITIQAIAGKGGDGVVRWRREKFIAKGGPNGGDGGRGGHVYIRAVRSFRVLDQYRSKKEFVAEEGGAGSGRSYKGADGKRLTIDFPVGSLVTNVTTGATYELNKEGQDTKSLAVAQAVLAMNISKVLPTRHLNVRRMANREKKQNCISQFH